VVADEVMASSMRGYGYRPGVSLQLHHVYPQGVMEASLSDRLTPYPPGVW
jgi:hypothetical protein